MITLKPQLVADLQSSLDGLRRALQTAIELEHSTLPPYLYALYSLKPGFNTETAAIIRSVVIQEMLHLALDCNVLNALGGSPSIDQPEFIPKYPGKLPGAVESGLTVGLAPCSINIIQNTFMVIEEPEDPLIIPSIQLLAAARHVTIGQFYEAIKQQILELSKHENIFTGDPARQLTSGLDGLIRVTDEDSAIAAINRIVEQGEGTATTPFDQESEPAHYYRFEQIPRGRKLVHREGDPPYAFAGDPIAFDPAGVWPAILNPSQGLYPKGTIAANLNNTFDYTYTGLLKSLHRTFNGDTGQLNRAIGLMESLKEQALTMMSQSFAPGQNIGPSLPREAPRLCRGGSRRLTCAGVHRGNSKT